MDNFVNITDVCSEIFAGGDAPKPNMSVTKTDEYKIPIFSNGEADNGLYGYTNFARVTKPSITVSARGTIGFVAVRNEPFVPIVRLISLTPDPEKIEIRYLYYAIQNYKFDGSGTSIPQLTVPMLKKYSFPLPTKEQQLAIIDQLDNVCNLISLRRQQFAKLDELVKSRFIEMFIGQGYPTKTIDEVSLVKGEYGAQSASVEYDPSRPRYVRITDINDDGTLNDDFVSSINPIDDEQYRLEYGDFMFARMGATVGKTYAFIEGNQIFAGYLIRYKLNQEIINPRYLYWYTRLDEYWNWVKLNQSGAAQPGINAKKYGSLQVPVPPMELQEQFAAFVKQTDKSKFEIQKSLEKLETLKKALMQKYFG